MSMSLKDAVNLCLRGATLDEVASLEEIDTDAQSALSTVEHQSTMLQLQAWWFNTEPNWKLTPDQNGEITVPAGASSIVTSGSQQYLRNLAIRGSRLYDMQNHTYNLTDLLTGDGYIELTFIMELPFTELPLHARTAIAYWARAQFAQDSEVDLEKAKTQSPELARAVQYLERENRRNKKTNMYYDNPTVSAQLSLIGGMNGRGYSVSTYPRRETY